MSVPDPQDISDQMRPIRKFLAQAKQLDKVEPKIAYLCRIHAASLALKLKTTNEDVKFILDLTNWLEENQSLVAGISKEDRQAMVDEFASHLFEAADQTDRSEEGSNEDTCRTFLAIAILIDVCGQFGPLSEPLQVVRRYSTWKAADIRRALKAGQKPMHGGPPKIDPFYVEPPTGEDDQLPAASISSTTPTPTSQITSKNSSTTTTANTASLNEEYPDAYPEVYGYASPRSQSQQQSQPQPQQQQQQQPHHIPAGAQPVLPPLNSQQQQYQAAPCQQQQQPQQSPHQFEEHELPPQYINPNLVPNSNGIANQKISIKANVLPRDKATVEAERLCRHAISAVQFDDVDTAIKKLTEALGLLVPYSSPQ